MALPPLQAVVLVGGEGSRLKPLTLARPKPVLPVRGRPMLGSLLEQLDRPWVEQVFLTVSYGVSHFEQFGARVVLEEERLGTGGAVRALRESLHGHTLVLNGDTRLELDLEAFYRFHLEHEAAVSVAVVEVDDWTPYGAVTFDNQNRITRFAEKEPGPARSGWVNAGAYLLSPEVCLPDKRVFSLERDFFPSLSPELFLAFPSDGSFQDLGTHDAYLQANLAVHHVDPGTVMGKGCFIEPPVYIGPGCVLGKGAFVSRCSLERDVQVGEGCHLSNSLIGPGVTLPAGTELHRQVLVEGEPPSDFGMSRA